MMSTAPSTLVDINALAAARPAADAPARLVAAWYERKAVMLNRIADESAPSERDTYQVWAEQAHAHAVRLVTGGGCGG